MRNEIYRSTLQYAMCIAGDELKLSERLEVSLGKLRNWLTGIEPIPDTTFFKAVDVVIEATPQDIARGRELGRKT